MRGRRQSIVSVAPKTGSLPGNIGLSHSLILIKQSLTGEQKKVSAGRIQSVENTTAKTGRNWLKFCAARCSDLAFCKKNFLHFLKLKHKIRTELQFWLQNRGDSQADKFGGSTATLWTLPQRSSFRSWQLPAGLSPWDMMHLNVHSSSIHTTCTE